MGFLVGTEQRAHAVAQRHIFFLEVFESVKADYGGTFVIKHAAADNPTFPFAHSKGVGGPALSCGDHIHMGYGGKVFFAFAANFAAAYAVFKIAGIKPKLRGNLQPKLKRTLRLLAEGRLRLRCALHAGHRNKAADIAQNSGAVLLNKGIYIFIVDFHCNSPFSINLL